MNKDERIEELKYTLLQRDIRIVKLKEQVEQLTADKDQWVRRTIAAAGLMSGAAQEIERLRAALTRISKGSEFKYSAAILRLIAREALNDKETQ